MRELCTVVAALGDEPLHPISDGRIEFIGIGKGVRSDIRHLATSPGSNAPALHRNRGAISIANSEATTITDAQTPHRGERRCIFAESA
jgi:hypothetical protein